MTMTNLANEVTCISVVLVCLLIRKLFGSPVAWLGAGLLAKEDIQYQKKTRPSPAVSVRSSGTKETWT
jgi:hypothetical protein